MAAFGSMPVRPPSDQRRRRTAVPGAASASAAVDPVEHPGHLDEPLRTAGYGLLVQEDPAPIEERPLAAIKPVADEGLHISYAIQWVLFAIMGFGGLAWAIRHEYRIRNADDPEVIAAEERREQRRLRRGRSDAEIEDELLDAR